MSSPESEPTPMKRMMDQHGGCEEAAQHGFDKLAKLGIEGYFNELSADEQPAANSMVDRLKADYKKPRTSPWGVVKYWLWKPEAGN